MLDGPYILWGGCTDKIGPAPYSSPSPALISKYGHLWAQNPMSAASMSAKLNASKMIKQWVVWGRAAPRVQSSGFWSHSGWFKSWSLTHFECGTTFPSSGVTPLSQVKDGTLETRLCLTDSAVTLLFSLSLPWKLFWNAGGACTREDRDGSHFTAMLWFPGCPPSRPYKLIKRP